MIQKGMMATHHDTGKKGEQMAADYLQQQGFTILHRNWRYSRYEIDIIASRGGILHFIEVKTRTTLSFGFPEESVEWKKMNSLLKGAEQFLFRYPYWPLVQYDVLAITMLHNEPVELLLIEDVYL